MRRACLVVLVCKYSDYHSLHCTAIVGRTALEKLLAIVLLAFQSMSNGSGRSRLRQQQTVRRVKEQADAYIFFNALTDQGMFE